ncbi:MAG: prephenate dehydrogenase [Thermoflexales bacterium]|nr:prephenate dehydrogenase [Thermoflexales bacterium]MCS7324215.1 prephenate dehydrogenase [Thermoflexales bacterium]MCX7939541.1 prephenate dehydrogenase [Thermoflexales bacterium]MDW8054751.1 prephenate dehydrogenase [Anaerolineae bacterium]MDW8292540.1 prephenate dehydrogenase [Anaerolineae bacterium]
MIVCIVGLGLMGASFASALRESGFDGRIVGVSRSAETLHKATTRGLVDSAADHLSVAAEADVIVLCTPVRTIVAQIEQLASLARSGTVITDMGSTKAAIVRAMNALPPHLRAVGSHPMCGKETSGIDAADPALFRGALWLLTRTQRTDDVALATVRTLAERVGAVPRELSAEQHDALLAFASHLPYAVAVGLVTAMDQFSLSTPEAWSVTAGGFRDTSRVAASDVTMWLDILLTNTDAVLAAVRDFQFALDQLTALLERRDEDGLRAYLTAAAQARRAHFA